LTSACSPVKSYRRNPSFLNETVSIAKAENSLGCFHRPRRKGIAPLIAAIIADSQSFPAIRFHQSLSAARRPQAATSTPSRCSRFHQFLIDFRSQVGRQKALMIIRSLLISVLRGDRRLLRSRQHPGRAGPRARRLLAPRPRRRHNCRRRAGRRGRAGRHGPGGAARFYSRLRQRRRLDCPSGI
jgi:hypothetical protein